MGTPLGMDENSVARGTELRLDTLMNGLESSVTAHTTSLSVGGVNMPVADVLEKVKDAVKPWKDSRAAQAVIREVAARREGDEEAAVSLLSDVKDALVAALGRESQKLTDFGFKPQKRRRRRPVSRPRSSRW